MIKSICILVVLIQSVVFNSASEQIQTEVEPLLICPCQYNYLPVCGSDGITYINDCLLNCSINQSTQKQTLQKVHNGECRTCICQKVNLPVCTLEALTFSNECELACTNFRRIKANQSIIYLAYRAPCIGPLNGCTDIASPVCGTDNILYRNNCVLETTNTYVVEAGLPPVKVKNNGACLDGFLCPLEVQKVCGSDGSFYNNACYVTSQNKRHTCSKYPFINIVDNSVCEGCPCKPVKEPVCGTDGRNYNNPCELDCEAKRQGNQDLKIAGYGNCSACPCTDENQPVCATDQKTYRNECELRCASAKRLDGYITSIDKYGECHPQGCSCNHCPPEYQPMCGTDGQTYWNLCWLDCNAGCLPKDKSSPRTLFLKRRGACAM